MLSLCRTGAKLLALLRVEDRDHVTKPLTIYQTASGTVRSSFSSGKHFIHVSAIESVSYRGALIKREGFRLRRQGEMWFHTGISNFEPKTCLRCHGNGNYFVFDGFSLAEISEHETEPVDNTNPASIFLVCSAKMREKRRMNCQ